MYPKEIVLPMKEELTNHGFKELLNAKDVDDALSQNGTIFIVINSVCGCSAGSARPGALKAVFESSQKPNKILTTFAGFDKEAVGKLREYLMPFPPSSPSMALFKDGKLVHFIERHEIEGHSADMVAENIKLAFQQFC